MNRNNLFSNVVFIFLTVSMFVHLCLAQPQHWRTDRTNYRSDIWKVDEGLPINSVSTLHQSRDGYLWIGTPEGLVQFDGNEFRTFTPENTYGMTSGRITCFAESPDGTLWAGTSGGGVLRIKHASFKSYTTKNGLSSNYIFSLAVDSLGLVWLGTNGQGVYTLVGDTILPWAGNSKLRSLSILEMMFDKQGVMWIGTGGDGLYKVTGSQSEHFVHHDQPRDNIVLALHADHTGMLWIGTQAGTLIRFKNNPYDHLNLLSPKFEGITSVIEDRSGAIWIGTMGRGVIKYENGQYFRYTKQEGLSNNFVTCIYEDREGSIWMGTDGGGLNRLRTNVLRTIAREDGLTEDVIHTLCEDHLGQLWIGTQGGGVTMLGNGSKRKFTSHQGLLNENVRSIFEDRSGTVWVGTQGGLHRFANQRMEPVITPIPVFSMMEDHNGNFWIGTMAGPIKIKDKQFKSYAEVNPVFRVQIFCMAEDQDGVIWFGTGGRGLIKLDHNEIRTFGKQEGLEDEVIRGMSVLSDHSLWLSTNTGLYRMKNGTLTRLSERVGLPATRIHQIIEDLAGNLWLPSNTGILMMSMKELNEVADGIRTHIEYAYFGTGDGMLTKECNGGNQPAAIRRRNGEILVPTARGVVVIDPARIQRPPVRPNVLMETIRVNGLRHTDFRQMQFARGAGDLEFTYAGITLLAPEVVQYRYKLEGYSDSWTYAKNRRTAYYTNIPSGKYRFIVEGALSPNEWEQSQAAISFELLPPFFERTELWVGLSGVVIVLLLMGFRSYKRYQERELQAIKLQAQLADAQLRLLKRQLHPHFLFNTLNAIAGFAFKTPQRAATMLVKLSDLLRKTLELEQIQLVPLSQEMELIKHYCDIEKVRFGKRLQIHFDLQIEAESFLVPPMLLQPLIENAIHHGLERKTGIGRINVSASLHNSSLSLEIKDNGQGLNDQSNATFKEHIGLSNTRQRLAQLYPLSHSIKLSSNDWGGTTVSIALSLNNTAYETHQ